MDRRLCGKIELQIALFELDAIRKIQIPLLTVMEELKR